MKSSLSLVLFSAGIAFATDPSGCHADNCLRAIRATSILPQASLDCSSFLVATATPPPVTLTVTSTQTEVVKRADTYYGPNIPAYASACTDLAEYSSACSCIGIHPSTTTLVAVSTTVTAIVTATPSCSGETCASGFVPRCDPDNDDCYCFTDSIGDGFCGENAPCATLTSCETDEDCTSSFTSSGDTCAFDTCCSNGPDDGLCLVGVCGNPLAKLRKMAIVARNHLAGDTAAFRAQ